MPGAQIMARSWLTAILLFLAGILVILEMPGAHVSAPRSERHVYTIQHLNPTPDLLILGSSMSILGFPPLVQFAASPGPDAPRRTGVRIAFPCSRSGELVSVLEAAIKQGVSTVLLEINHFLYSLKPCTRGDDWRTLLGNFVRALRIRIKRAIYARDGTLEEVAVERKFLDRTYDGNTSSVTLPYPAHLRPLDAFDPLQPLFAEAERRGVKIILVVMPRSETAARYLGSEFDEEFAARLAELRNRFGDAVWEPARSWPDRYFADWAHMNRTGRARLVAEMQDVVGAAR